MEMGPRFNFEPFYCHYLERKQCESKSPCNSHSDGSEGSRVRRFTGWVEPFFEASEAQRLARPDRIRAPGAGHPWGLDYRLQQNPICLHLCPPLL